MAVWRCRADAPCGAVEKLHIPFMLQRLNAFGQRGMGQMHFIRGLRKAAQTIHRLKILNLPNIKHY
jgi:hypothetical protein